MEDSAPWGGLSQQSGLSEESLRQELAYCKARLTDIENAPSGSRHRQDRARVLRQIGEIESALASLQRPHIRPRRHVAKRLTDRFRA